MSALNCLFRNTSEAIWAFPKKLPAFGTQGDKKEQNKNGSNQQGPYPPHIFPRVGSPVKSIAIVKPQQQDMQAKNLGKNFSREPKASTRLPPVAQYCSARRF